MLDDSEQILIIDCLSDSLLKSVYASERYSKILKVRHKLIQNFGLDGLSGISLPKCMKPENPEAVAKQSR